MKCLILFWGKNEINIINLLSVVFADSVLSITDDTAVSIFTHSIRALQNVASDKGLHCLPFNKHVFNLYHCLVSGKRMCIITSQFRGLSLHRKTFGLVN